MVVCRKLVHWRRLLKKVNRKSRELEGVFGVLEEFKGEGGV
jgi:hypothetical protein